MSVMFCDVELPDDFVMAQESRNIIYFVGAGVSCNAGLPSAKELLKKIERKIGVRRSDSREVLAKGYEFYYEKLQRQYPNLKREIEKFLMPRSVDESKLHLHEALLKLSYNQKGNIKIITTNFDDLFHRAAKRIGVELKNCYSAPLLPPCDSDWSGLVYLHGQVRTKGGQDVEKSKTETVLTLSDYGYAYMTNGYASTFLVELFRTHTVCFVGYSADENVIKYILSSIASDVSRATFPNPIFAFDTYVNEQNRIEKYNNWMEQNVTPILIENAAGDFEKHTTFFEGWSVFINSQSLIKKNVAKDEMMKGENSNINLLAWALCDEDVAREILSKESSNEEELLAILNFLRHSISPNHEPFAAIFSKVLYSTECPYSIFLQENELDKGEKPNQVALEMVDLRLISKNLVTWLLRFVKTDRLIQVVSERYPALSHEFLHELTCVLPNVEWADGEDYKSRFWNYVQEYAQMDYWLKQKASSTDIFFEIRNIDILSEENDEITRRRLKEIFALKCYPKRENWQGDSDIIEKIDFLEPRWWQEYFKAYLPECNGTNEVPARWFIFFENTVLRLSERIYKLAPKSSWWRIQRVFQALRDNDFEEDWAILISLLRQATTSLAKKNTSEALKRVQRWMEWQYPIFQFMIFQIVNDSSIVPISEVVRWLLKDNCKILLNWFLREEVQLFIENRGAELLGNLEARRMFKGAILEFYNENKNSSLYDMELLANYLTQLFKDECATEFSFMRSRELSQVSGYKIRRTKPEAKWLHRVSVLETTYDKTSNTGIVTYFVEPNKDKVDWERSVRVKSKPDEWREFISNEENNREVIFEILDKCKDHELLKKYRSIFFESFDKDNALVWSYIINVGVLSLIDIIDVVMKRVYRIVQEWPEIDSNQLCDFLQQVYDAESSNDINVEKYDMHSLSQTAFLYLIRILWMLKKRTQKEANAEQLLKRLLTLTLTCKNSLYRGVIIRELNKLYSLDSKWVKKNLLPLLKGEKEQKFYWRCFLSVTENGQRIKDVLDTFLMIVNDFRSEPWWEKICLIHLFNLGLYEKNAKVKRCARFKLREVLETSLYASTLMNWLMKEEASSVVSQKKYYTFFFDVFSCKVYEKVDAGEVIKFVFYFKRGADAILQYFINRNLIDFKRPTFWAQIEHSYVNQLKEFAQTYPDVFYSFVLAIYKSRCLASGYNLRLLEECLIIACNKKISLQHCLGYELIQKWLWKSVY